MNLYKKNIQRILKRSVCSIGILFDKPQNSLYYGELFSSRMRHVSKSALRLRSCQSLSSDLRTVVQAMHLKCPCSDHSKEGIMMGLNLQGK